MIEPESLLTEGFLGQNNLGEIYLLIIIKDIFPLRAKIADDRWPMALSVDTGVAVAAGEAAPVHNEWAV